MKTINVTNKKVGIWGFGIVGQSIARYLKNQTSHIQILDKNPISPLLGITHPIILQTPQNIQQFLNDNDFIIASPGIVLESYQKYAHKFICELDIFAQDFKHKTVAITGTVGKTTITNLLSQSVPSSIAAGNIGFAMLDVITQNIQKTAILELSSYQLHYAQNFAPDLAIWSNFFANHLDHHATKKEYFNAKCNLFTYQTKNQIALLPANLLEKIQKSVTVHAQIYLFMQRKPQKTIKYPTFFIHKNNIVLAQNGQEKIIFENIKNLPDITFAQNWLIIIAAMHLQDVSLEHFAQTMHQFPAQKHRLELVKNIGKCAVYNDSKSTVWQATAEALKKFKGKNIALFLGGLSKGTNREPLIKKLKKNNITVFAFGAERENIVSLCAQYRIICLEHETMQAALENFANYQQTHPFNVLLFSPAGASLDQFKNYEDRGDQFKKIIQTL